MYIYSMSHTTSKRCQQSTEEIMPHGSVYTSWISAIDLKMLTSRSDIQYGIAKV